jgi:small subunit ribosomal protein S21
MRIIRSISLYASKICLKGVISLSEVKFGENDSFETALKRFNRKIQQDGILAEARRREHYEKPSVKRKREEAAKRRKAMRKGQ